MEISSGDGDFGDDDDDDVDVDVDDDVDDDHDDGGGADASLLLSVPPATAACLSPDPFAPPALTRSLLLFGFVPAAWSFSRGAPRDAAADDGPPLWLLPFSPFASAGNVGLPTETGQQRPNASEKSKVETRAKSGESIGVSGVKRRGI